MNEERFRRIDEIQTFFPGQIDNFFILWASPEERCFGSVQKLSSNYKTEKFIIFVYNHKSVKREENILKIKEIIKNKGEIEEVSIDEEVPLLKFKIFSEKIKSILKNKEKPNITIDISTAIKWHLLILLKFFNSVDLLQFVRIIYSEPIDYTTDIFQPLSFGLKKIFPIPTYFGHYDFSRENLLVIMLGFEGNRAYSLYENIDPAETILLIAKPPYHDNWDGRAEYMNQKIINLVGERKIKYIDARDPFKVASQLIDILNKDEYSQYNLLISPLGTKLQLIGLFLYICLNPNSTNLIYSVPFKHNELFYSHGTGDIWEIRDILTI
ncbi:MAG: hypothetical protein ACTSU9_17355 [Promethearchaeota archaeon]